MTTGDKVSPIWSTSLRLRSRVTTLRKQSHAILIGPAVNFSLIIRTNVYEARGDFIVSGLEFVGCEQTQ